MSGSNDPFINDPSTVCFASSGDSSRKGSFEPFDSGSGKRDSSYGCGQHRQNREPLQVVPWPRDDCANSADGSGSIVDLPSGKWSQRAGPMWTDPSVVATLTLLPSSPERFGMGTGIHTSSKRLNVPSLGPPIRLRPRLQTQERFEPASNSCGTSYPPIGSKLQSLPNLGSRGYQTASLQRRSCQRERALLHCEDRHTQSPVFSTDESLEIRNTNQRRLLGPPQDIVLSPLRINPALQHQGSQHDMTFPQEPITTPFTNPPTAPSTQIRRRVFSHPQYPQRHQRSTVALHSKPCSPDCACRPQRANDHPIVKSPIPTAPRSVSHPLAEHQVHTPLQTRCTTPVKALHRPIKSDTVKGTFARNGLDRDVIPHLTASSDAFEQSPGSIRSDRSVFDSDNEVHETPLTTPASSPTKPSTHIFHSSLSFADHQYLDGVWDDVATANIATLEVTSLRESIPIASSDHDTLSEDGRESRQRIASAHKSLAHHVGSQGSDLEKSSIRGPESEQRAATYPQTEPTIPPLGPPIALSRKSVRHGPADLSTQRRPSALLQYCEQNASARQRRLLASIGSPGDRFISSRVHTPTKESLLLRRPNIKRMSFGQCWAYEDDMIDPFSPNPFRSLRSPDRFATIRRLPPAASLEDQSRAYEPILLRTSRRPVSPGAVWTVGGTMVTEGVASVANGRGGRITSGTSAPHFSANFLRRPTMSDEERAHRQRLAAAMEVDQHARILTHSSPQTHLVHNHNYGGMNCRTKWSNGIWEQDAPFSRKLWQLSRCRRPADPVVKATKAKRRPKEVPVIPFRVLDAPALRDDYYCSLLSYSQTMGCLAVGLGPHVYLWSESRRTVPTRIPDALTTPYGAHVTSLSFSSAEGGSGILAIGRADGRITLWSPKDHDPRFDSEQPAPVSCVCFRPKTVSRLSVRDGTSLTPTEELLVGDEMGNVYLYSIEWPEDDLRDLFNWNGSMTLHARISCHNQQICGIAWSTDCAYFASGGNDNRMFLFDTKRLLSPTDRARTTFEAPVNVRNGDASQNWSIPGQGEVITLGIGRQKHTFNLNAAVKAIAFAPWQSTLVAAGGGSNDRCIHFFHAASGSTLATLDCHAQVTALVWSHKRKEIAATFGFAQPEHPYRIAVFAWPSCQRVVAIPWWSEERALYAVAYPGGPSGALPKGCQTDRNGQRSKTDREGRAWYGKRTREEGCLVIATSDASIKFHEVWPEGRGQGGGTSGGGSLGGSQILEGEVSPEVERHTTIR